MTLDHTVATAGIRPAAVEQQPRLIAVTEAGWPAAGAINELVEGGLRAVVIAESIQICDETAAQALDFIRFLRDCETFSLEVSWRGRFAGRFPLELLSHLQPPSTAPRAGGSHNQSAGEPPYAFGRFYWRSGPGFVTIRDTRPARESQRITIAEESELRLFKALQAPVRLADCEADGVNREALAALTEEGIVLRLGDWALSLPCRMRFWPVPYMAV